MLAVNKRSFMFEMHGHTLTSDVHDQNMRESSVNVI